MSSSRKFMSAIISLLAVIIAVPGAVNAAPSLDVRTVPEPHTTLPDGTHQYAKSAAVNIHWTSNDPAATFECKDGSVVWNCSMNGQPPQVYAYSNVQKFTITAKDAAGATTTVTWMYQGADKSTTPVTPVQSPKPVVPAVNQIKLATLKNKRQTIATVAKAGKIVVTFPVTAAGVRMVTQARISRAQAVSIGLAVPKKATHLVIGTTTKTSKAAGRQTAEITLTNAAKKRFTSAANVGSTIRQIKFGLNITLTKNKKSATRQTGLAWGSIKR